MACARQTDRQTDKRQLTPHYTWLHGKMCDLRDNDMRSGEEYLSLEIMRLISLMLLNRPAESSTSLATACVTWGPVGDRLSSVGRRMPSSCNRRLIVNVSGLRFETYLSTVERFNRTLLGDASRRDRSVITKECN